MTEKLKILIVDDDLDLVESTKLMLESDGYFVISAYEPDSVLYIAEKERPALIILDIMFGASEEINGTDLLRQLKSKKGLESIPVLMISSMSLETAKGLAVDGFIDKPARQDVLLGKVKEVLNRNE